MRSGISPRQDGGAALLVIAVDLNRLPDAIDLVGVAAGEDLGGRAVLGVDDEDAADLVLAQDLERLVSGRRTVVSEFIDASLSCGHFAPPRYGVAVQKSASFLLNQRHTRSISCWCPSIPKFANECAAQ